MADDITTDENPEHNYREAFNTYGESPKALRWSNYRSAALHLKHLTIDLEIGNKSILDVGCGMGDVLPFLYAKTDNFEYLGVDINSDFINIARKRYEGHEFQILDPFKEKVGRTFDFVLSSGTLNSNIPGWQEDRKQKIAKLFELADEALIFNMAGSFGQIPRGRTIAYADAQNILDFCLTLSPKVILKTHYHPKDFTIVIFK